MPSPGGRDSAGQLAISNFQFSIFNLHPENSLPVKRILPHIPLLLFTVVSLNAQPAASFKPLFTDAAPICAPEDLRKVTVPNTTIDSVNVDAAEGSVRIVATVSHPPAHDHVKVFVALPLKNWNGRFRGNGGGGFVGGTPESLRGPVRQGFATASTDTGHEGGSGSFALNADGRLNWQDIRDNAYLGIHDMTVVGKALTQAFYGKAPRYSYFIGSSTGGRQGLSEAQRFPEDYNGIYSGCPAVNWPRFLTADLWPQVVMLDAKNFVSKAKLDAATAAAVAACDGADGVVDGVIDDPVHCTWDPKALVGTKVGDAAFTEADASVLRQIWDGPRGHDGKSLWFGLTRGTNLFALGGTDGSPLAGKPFSITMDWLRYFLLQNARWDWTALTKGEFELIMSHAEEEYAGIFGTDNPDLTHFRDHGGKVIIMHGLADQLIPHRGTIDYYERVQRRMGGAEKAAEFARLFLVPGVDHGMRGAGAAASPATLLEALVHWVEDGQAPNRLHGEARDKDGKVLRTRPLFPYPQFAKYKGSGRTDDAENFVASGAAR